MSVFGILASIIVAVVCVAYSINEIAQPHHSANHRVLDARMFPSAFSAITLSFGGHATMPTIESHASSKNRFLSIINVAFFVLVALYLPTAIFGYWAFGDRVYSPILCNFPHSAVIPIIAKVIVAIHCLSAYPILINVVFNELESSVFPPLRFQFLPRSLLRALIIGCTGTVAYFVPYFAAFMTLVGACCVTMMVFVLPVVFRLRLLPSSRLEIVWGCVVVIVGLIGGSVGAYQAMRDLIHLLSTNASPSG